MLVPGTDVTQTALGMRADLVALLYMNCIKLSFDTCGVQLHVQLCDESPHSSWQVPNT